MRILLSSAIFLATATSLAAQDRTIERAGLPRAVEERLSAIANNPATRQINGAATISEQHVGDVVVYNVRDEKVIVNPAGQSNGRVNIRIRPQNGVKIETPRSGNESGA